MWPLLILGGAYALLARSTRRNPDWYTDAKGRHHPIRQGDGRAGDKTPYSRELGKDSATPRASRKVYMSEQEATEHFTELKRQRDKKFAEQMRKNRQDPAIKALYEEEKERRARLYEVYRFPGPIKRAIIASQSGIAANATAKQRKAAAFKAMRLEGVVDVRMLEDFWASYNYVGYIPGD